MKLVFRSLTIVAALAAITSFAPTTAQARSFCEGAHGNGHAHHFKKMAAELGLSEQQKQQVREIMQKNRPQCEPLIKQKRAEQAALRALVQADRIDEAAIRAQAARVGALEADLALQRAHSGQEIRKVLNPDQVRKFRELRATCDQRQEKFHGHAGKRHGQDK